MTSNTEMAALAAVPERIVAAWAKNDAEAFSKVFAKDATMILPEVFVEGREKIRDFMAAGYAGQYRGTRVTGKPLAAKVIGTGAAVVVTQGGVLAPGESEVAPERAIRATWTLTKQNGEWLIAAYQNTPIAD